MALPTFLGIGVPRAGTTWLHELLAAHPDVYVPNRRKEIHFFDKHYELGIHWYEGFFPSDEHASRYQAIGEITARYFCCDHCAERISQVPSVRKLILILRNPVDRAYSHYGMRIREGLFSGSFEDFLSSHPDMIQMGFYSRALENYFSHFNKEQILLLIFEHAMADIPNTKGVIANFLGVAVDRFPPTAGTKKVNISYIPIYQSAYALFGSVARNLRGRNLDWIVNFGKSVGIRRLFGTGGSLPPKKEETRKRLWNLYEPEIRALECLLQMDLECWR